MPPATRFSAAWTQGDAGTFARIVGASFAMPINSEDPIHSERIRRYETNIQYFNLAQYHQHNLPLIHAQDFLNLRVNYASICKRSIEMKAAWLFGQPVGIRPTPLDKFGNPAKSDTGAWESNPMTDLVKGRINQIRQYNESQYWDYVMAMIGMTCGDFFTKIDCDADDVHPQITILDPAFCYPDYPADNALPMRAFQLQYDQPMGAHEEDMADSMDTPMVGSLSNERIVEDWRLEVIDSANNETDLLEEFEVLSDEDMKALSTEQVRTGRPDPRLTCVYRIFVDGILDPDSVRNIGIPAIPIVHGLNTYNWIARYGGDEISALIPLVEKYNEMFFYAERVARTNAHAKLALSGVRKDSDGKESIKGDFDDVIFLGEKGTASVLSLPSDKTILEFVTDALETEMHRLSHIPVIAQGETEIGYGAVSGLALEIRFLPLQSITNLHQTFYGRSLIDQYTLCLMMDEMVIQGQEYGAVYKYDQFSFNFDWHDATPKAETEIIADMMTATSRAGGAPLLSLRSARERIPGVDPDVEEARVKQETAELEQQSLGPAGAGGGFGGGNGGGGQPDDFMNQINDMIRNANGGTTSPVPAGLPDE